MARKAIRFCKKREKKKERRQTHTKKLKEKRESGSGKGETLVRGGDPFKSKKKTNKRTHKKRGDVQSAIER